MQTTTHNPPGEPSAPRMGRRLRSDFQAALQWLRGADASSVAPNPESEIAFRAAMRQKGFGPLVAMMSAMMVLDAISFIFDLFIFADDAPALRYAYDWRLASMLPVCAALFVLIVFRRLRPYTRETVWLAGCVACFGVGYSTARMGGLDTHWFYMSYALPLTSMVFSGGLRIRVVITLSLLGALLLGYFGARPEYLKFDYLSTVFSIYTASCGFAIAFGHLFYRRNRTHFFVSRAIEAERARAEELLLSILPAAVALQLKENPNAVADVHAGATILFADIVEFTPHAQAMTPAELVAMLNRLFSDFDAEAQRLGIEKIKTIGDAYMAAGGLPFPRADHAEAVAELALAMQAVVATYRWQDGTPVRLRIGINSGPVVAGVIGATKFIYDVWGDVVNTASRMESSGEMGTIQVTEATHAILRDRYRFGAARRVHIKGKGELTTYCLTGVRA